MEYAGMTEGTARSLVSILTSLNSSLSRIATVLEGVTEEGKTKPGDYSIVLVPRGAPEGYKEAEEKAKSAKA